MLSIENLLIENLALKEKIKLYEISTKLDFIKINNLLKKICDIHKIKQIKKN